MVKMLRRIQLKAYMIITSIFFLHQINGEGTKKSSGFTNKEKLPKDSISKFEKGKI